MNNFLWKDSRNTLSVFFHPVSCRFTVLGVSFLFNFVHATITLSFFLPNLICPSSKKNLNMALPRLTLSVLIRNPTFARIRTFASLIAKRLKGNQLESFTQLQFHDATSRHFQTLPHLAATSLDIEPKISALHNQFGNCDLNKMPADQQDIFFPNCSSNDIFLRLKSSHRTMKTLRGLMD